MPPALFDPDAPMDAARTVAVYETLRHRMPSGGNGRAERHRSLRDILGRFDALLLDGYGVLNVGDGAVPGAAALVDGAAAAGLPVVVLSNGASRPSSAGKYLGIGLSVGEGQVVSSRDALVAGMADMPGPIGVGGRFVELPGGDGRFTLLDPSRPEEWRRMAAVAFVGSTGWDARWQECLLGAMAAGVPVHVANPDVAAPHEGGFSLEPGFWVAAALDGRPDAEVHWHGKPHGAVFELALAKLAAGGGGVDRERVAMVGDTLHTDILGANAAGLTSVLVTGHGLFRDGGADEAMESAGILPDFVTAKV